MKKRVIAIVIGLMSISFCQEAVKKNKEEEDKQFLASWRASQSIVKTLSSRAQSLFSQAKRMQKKKQLKEVIDPRDRFFLDLYAGKRVDIPIGALNEARTVKFSKVPFNATPLMAALLGGYLHVMEYLLKKGANPNGVNKDGLTALHLAARSGLTNAAHKLLDFGADPNLKDKAGMTPLMYAVMRNSNNKNLGVITLLLTYGADVNLKNNQGKTALDYAQVKHDDAAIQLLKPKSLECEYDENLKGVTCHFGIPM